MSGNQSPIFSRVGDIQGSVIINNPVSAAFPAAYTGNDANVYSIYVADAVNGGFVQRIRIKPMGTNPANVVRFWINNGLGNLTTTTTAPQTPYASISTSAGTMTPGLYYAKIQAIDALGQPGAFSTEVSNTVPSTGNNIIWSWAAPATGPAAQGISSYRIVVGTGASQEQVYFANVTSNSMIQTTSYLIGSNGTISGGFIGQVANSSATFSTSLTYNNTLIGEVSVPATAATATAALPDIDYPLNIALPPGYRILAGLGTLTANGVMVTTVAGKY